MFSEPMENPDRVRPVAALLRELSTGSEHPVVIRLVGHGGGRWMAFCDDPLPIPVEEDGPGAPIELIWADQTTTRATLGCETPTMRRTPLTRVSPGPTSRRFVIGEGVPPPPLTSQS